MCYVPLSDKSWWNSGHPSHTIFEYQILIRRYLHITIINHHSCFYLVLCLLWIVGKLNRQYYRLHLEAVHSINDNCERLLNWTLSQQNLDDSGGGPAATISSVANIMKMKGITIERSKASLGFFGACLLCPVSLHTNFFFFGGGGGLYSQNKLERRTRSQMFRTSIGLPLRKSRWFFFLQFLFSCYPAHSVQTFAGMS